MSYQNDSCIKFDHCYNTNIISTSCTYTFGQHRLINIYMKLFKNIEIGVKS